MFVHTDDDEGLYNLYFHACPNYDPDPRNTYFLSFNVDIEENNNGNYLSATEMPLPILYFLMSVIYFLSGLLWIYVLRQSKHPVFKIHYLMGVLVFLKSLSLMFHSINFHFIEIKGEHVETWAILYYITHLLKGACLFITIGMYIPKSILINCIVNVYHINSVLLSIDRNWMDFYQAHT